MIEPNPLAFTAVRRYVPGTSGAASRKLEGDRPRAAIAQLVERRIRNA